MDYPFEAFAKILCVRLDQLPPRETLEIHAMTKLGQNSYHAGHEADRINLTTNP